MIDLTAPAILFATQYVFVFAKSSQQLNVCNFKWLRIPLMSYIMAYLSLFELAVAGFDMLENGIWRISILGFFYGTGGWLGSWTGMWVYLRMKR